MLDSKFIYLKYILLIFIAITLQSITALTFEMSEQGLRKAARQYLAIYKAVDEDVISDFVDVVRRHPDIFNYLAEVQTGPEFLPYIEKYANMKMKLTDQSINNDIKIIFSNNPLRASNYSETIVESTTCNLFTRTILVDRGSWNYYQDEKLREALLSHEMGHCDLNRNHSRDMKNENFSFMDAGIIEFLLLPNLPTITDLTNNGYFRGYYPSHEIRANMMIEARSNLDHTFEIMYQELFSMENTISNLKCQGLTIIENGVKRKILPEACILTPEDIFQLFEAAIPIYYRYMATDTI